MYARGNGWNILVTIFWLDRVIVLMRTVGSFGPTCGRSGRDVLDSLRLTRGQCRETDVSLEKTRKMVTVMDSSDTFAT